MNNDMTLFRRASGRPASAIDFIELGLTPEPLISSGFRLFPCKGNGRLGKINTDQIEEKLLEVP